APAGGVEGWAGEVLQARQWGGGGDRELTAGRDQDVCGMGAGRGVQPPTARLLVPARARDLGAGSHPLEHAVAARDVLEIGLYLGLGCVAARPARVGREGELVQ